MEIISFLNQKKLLQIFLIIIKKEINDLIDNAKRGSWVRSGLKVALTGKPNVGKSSLLNRLSKQEKAIVTDLPGTTRDLLESEIVLEGIPGPRGLFIPYPHRDRMEEMLQNFIERSEIVF